MLNLKLIIKRPGSLLSKVLEAEITEQQAAVIRVYLTNPDGYVLAVRRPIGFARPEERN